MMTEKELEDFEELLCCIAGIDVVNMAIYLEGRNEETFNAILYYHTGYRSYEQYCAENS